MKNKSVVYAFGMEVRSNKNTEEGQRFQGRFCAWCSVPRPVGSAPVDFAMPGQRKFFSQQLEKFEFRPPIHHSDFNAGKWQEQGSFFLRGWGRVLPSCPPALGAIVPTPRTPNPEPHPPPLPAHLRKEVRKKSRKRGPKQ